MNRTHIGSLVHVPTGNLETALRETLAAIDSVHWTLALPAIPLGYDAERFGGYCPATEERPRQISLSLAGPHPRLTLVHEIGHYLDDSLGNFVVYSTTKADSVLSEVVQAIENSRAIIRMRHYLASEHQVIAPVRYQLLNWLEPVEGWARAYAQYITLRSGNRALRRDLKMAIDLGGIEIYRHVQWEDSDFEPIAETIDAAFRRLGWRR